MKITDFTLKEYGPAGSRAMGAGNFGDLVNFFRGQRRSENLILDFGNQHSVSLTTTDVDAIADYYNSLPDMQAKHDFVYGIMARYDRFLNMARNLRLSIPAQKSADQPDLFERKKSSQTDLDRTSVRDPKLAVALRQAYSRYPSAASDIEAFIRQELEATADAERNFGTQNRVNDRQDRTIDQLRDLSRKQSQRISALDRENDELDDELNRLSKEISSMDRQASGYKQAVIPKDAEKAPDKPKSSPDATLPGGDYTPTTGEKRREGSKVKRQAQAGGKPVIKYSGSVPTVKSPKTPEPGPAAPSPAVAPAAAPVEPTTVSQLPTKISRDQPAANQAELDFDTLPKSDNVTYMFGEPVEIPANQPAGAPVPGQMVKDLPRTGTMGEDIDRIKHLAGI